MLNQKILHYKITRLIGQGGMAKVYLAHDKKFDSNVAIKFLNKEFIHNENIRKRFLAEARNMFRMSHTNIIKVTDLIEENDTVAFVMEYIEGETLKDYLERKGKLSDEEIKTIFTQMLAAVSYVHEQGLIHRDIKPSNFMISPKGQVKLLDFGIAKNTVTNSAEYTQTSTSQQMGTPMYMSPEQVNETKSVTAQSDIYSLGVVLWQMVMGQKPYDTRTLSTFQLQSKIVNENLALTNTNWDNRIQKATHKNIDSRYTSAQLFLNDLQNPTAAKVDKTAFEKNDDVTVIQNDNTIIKNDEFPNIKIGTQIWMKENLNIDRFRNGDLIPEAKTSEEWEKAGENQKPAWCYYDNDPVNGEKYGKLYNWFAVIDPRGLAPEGWHIPSNEDWASLIGFLGGEELAGYKLKSLDSWLDNELETGNGKNESGFNGLPSGGRNHEGEFLSLGTDTCFWSTTLANSTYPRLEDDPNYACVLSLEHYLYARCYYDANECGYPVRCIRDYMFTKEDIESQFGDIFPKEGDDKTIFENKDLTYKSVNKYSVDGTLSTPYISFDLDKGMLIIRGPSISKNSFEFYKPLLYYLDKYAIALKPVTLVNIQLDYFNTSSSKCLLDVFKKLESIRKSGSSVTINWLYEEDDKDLLECGKDFEAIINIPFKMVKINE